MSNRNNNSDIFRKESLARFTSPENLDKYIRSTTPSLWLLLATIIVILVGVIVWGSFGKIDSTSVVGCSVENNGIITSYISETGYEKICDESYIEINGEKYDITSISGPFIVGSDSNSFLIQASEIESGSWYYIVRSVSNLSNGEYKGKIVYEKISPISFIIN